MSFLQDLLGDLLGGGTNAGPAAGQPYRTAQGGWANSPQQPQQPLPDTQTYQAPSYQAPMADRGIATALGGPPTGGDTPYQRPAAGPSNGQATFDRGVSAQAPSGLYDPRAARTIINGFIAEGYDPKFAVGMAANAMIESGGNPTAFNASEGSFGAFQHRLDRLDNLRSFADRMGKDANDLGDQVSFSIHEFQGSERVAYDRIMGGDPQSAAEYAALQDQYYERSDGRARGKREALATEIYRDFYGADAVFGGDQEMLSFGEEIDPMGVQDNVARMRSQDPSLFTNMGQDASQPLNPMAEYMLGDYGPEIRSPDQFQYPPRETRSPDQFQYPDTAAQATPTPTPTAVPAGGDYSMGTYDNAPAGGAGQSQTSSASAATPPDSGGGGESAGTVQTFLDKIYGTSDLSDEERAIRRRSMTEAFAEGLGYLTRGTADLSGVFNRKSEAYAALDAKEQAQADAQIERARADSLHTMASNMGLGEIAGLAYQGASGTAALSQAMTASLSSGGTGDNYDMSAENREMLAASIEGTNPAGAQIIRTATGQLFEDTVKKFIDYEAPTGGDSDVLPSAASFGQFAAANGGSPELVDAISNATTASEISTGLDQLSTATGKPTSQLEYEFRETLTPDEQAQWDASQRNKSGVVQPANQPSNPQQEIRLKEIAAQNEIITTELNKSERLAADMRIMRQAAMDPAFQSGVIEEKFMLPLTNLANTFGVDLGLLTEEGGPLRVVQSIAKKSVGTFRVVGSGSSSDFDAKMYLLSGANASDTRTNLLMVSQYHLRGAEMLKEQSQLRDQYLNEHQNDASYYDKAAMEKFVTDNQQRSDIFPVINLPNGPADLATVREMTDVLAADGKIAEGDFFIAIYPDGSREYMTYGIPGFTFAGGE